MRLRTPRRPFALLAAAFVLLAAPAARAQWTRETGVKSDILYGVFARGDTVLAAGDTAVWVSTNRGGTWTASAPVGVVPASLNCAWFRDGRLWAGTTGQGVFSSDDLGASWQWRGDGLAGGLFDSHNTILGFTDRGDNLYAATGGAGVFVRPLRTAGPWQPTGTQLVDYQAGSVEGIASHDGRLLAVGGANGLVFHNDGGAPWVETFLDNNGPLPSLAPYSVVWTGSAWLVGTDHGVFRSADGAQPWAFTGLALGNVVDTRLAAGGGRAFAVVNRSGGGVLRWTRDNGATWSALETLPAWPSALAVQGDRLWASRFDGLWYRNVSTLDVPLPVPQAGSLSVRGAHPVRGPHVLLGFRLASPATARLELFDTTGRRVRQIDRELPAGGHEIAMDVRAVAPGVYHARLTTPDRVETLRLVRLD